MEFQNQSLPARARLIRELPNLRWHLKPTQPTQIWNQLWPAFFFFLFFVLPVFSHCQQCILRSIEIHEVLESKSSGLVTLHHASSECHQTSLHSSDRPTHPTHASIHHEQHSPFLHHRAITLAFSYFIPYKKVVNSVKLRWNFLWSAFLMIVHEFYMGLRSGVWLGHSKLLIFLFWSYSLVGLNL